MALEMQSKRFFIAPIWMARLAIIACVLIIGNWFVFIPWKLDLIMLAKKDAKIYANLAKVTQNFVEAGEKTSLDTDIMKNSLHIRKLDQKIYKIDKQVQLLKLYIRIENVL